MAQLGLAILMMFSAWAGWRRNPMYSTRSTVRTLLVIGLAIGGSIGLIIATVNLTAHSPMVVVAGAMAAVIIVNTLALIFIIQAVSVPKESKPAALPHGVRLVTTNRVKLLKWVKVISVLIIVFALGGLIPGPVRYVSLTLAGFTLFLSVILLPVLYVNMRGLDQALTATEVNPWVHWRYTQYQWQQWSAVQVERLRATPATFILRRDWHRFLFPVAAIAGGVAIFCPGSWLFKTIYVTAVCVALLILVVLSGRDGGRSADKLHARLLAASPEAWFGRDGIFCDGVFTPWLNMSVYLLSANIDERQPRSLMFNFERSVPNAYGPTQTIAIHQAVLLPGNFANDLARLQQELTARCPKANIVLA